MKNFIFSFVWAAVCAWAAVKLAVWLDARYAYSQAFVLPAVIDFFHGYGFAVRKVLFWSLLLIFFGSGLHKFIGNILLQFIGWAILLIAIALVVIVGWYFLKWISGTL